MRKYTRKKASATKKKALSQKESEEKLKRKRAAAKKATAKKATAKKATAKKAAKKATAKKAAKKTTAKKAAKKTTAKKAAKKTTAKKAAKKPVKRKKSPAQKRREKNKKIVKRVEERNRLRDKSRGKGLKSKRKRNLERRAREEKKRIEAQRLFDEKLRQIQEEKQRANASGARILGHLQRRFGQLISEAKRTGQLPRAPRQQKIDSERLKGFRRYVNIGEVLVPELIPQIMYQVKEKAKTLPQKPSQGWLGVINFASLGESLLGYGQVILSSSLPGASLFQVQGIISTGLSNSREGMFIALEEKLEDLAAEASATVYINFISMSAYTRRV